MRETRITADLPNLRIDLGHRKDEEADAEAFAVRLVTGSKALSDGKDLASAWLAWQTSLATTPLLLWSEAARASLGFWQAALGPPRRRGPRG